MRIDLVNKENNRFYSMQLIEDLFGEKELMVSKGSNKKKSTITYYNGNYEFLKNKFDKLLKIRLKHGYQLS